MTRKAIYQLFVERGIYLPKYALDAIESDVKERINKGESLFKILYEYESDKKYNKYINKVKGQYIMEPSERNRRAIIMVGEEEKYFDSIYAAAKSLGLTKNSVGNISKAANGKTNVAYGHKWKWAI